MCAEETKDKKDKTTCTDFGCNPENFKGMFEMMNKCFTGQSGAHNCSAIMESMKKGDCCSQATEEKKKESCC